MQKAIEIRDISKRFYLRQTKRVSFFKGLISSPEYFRQQRELWALKDINLSVYEGECIGLIGLNGSGKSTLLKILEGIYTPTSGEVLLGYDTAYLQLGLGFNQELSVGENVFLQGAVMGLEKKKLEACFDEIIEFAELEDFTEAKLRTLSSGMVQRLAFSTAMRTESRILLLDEVFSVGDEIFIKKCKKAMSDFREQGRTILFASHQKITITETCTKALVLQEGKQMFYGPVKEAIETYDKIINK